MNKKAAIYILISLIFIIISKFLKSLLFANSNPLVMMLIILPMIPALIFGVIGWCFLIFRKDLLKLRYMQHSVVGSIWGIVIYLIIFEF